MGVKILAAKSEHSKVLAAIVSESNKDIAELFGLNSNNAPKHPSFCTEAWIHSDFQRGQGYFLATENSTFSGCVAFEQPNAEKAYLNRLSVLPEYRHRGIGAALVEHIVDYSRTKGIKTISIGIIAEHQQLKDWYASLGFLAANTKRFEHLPFDVLYMTRSLELS